MLKEEQDCSYNDERYAKSLKKSSRFSSILYLHFATRQLQTPFFKNQKQSNPVVRGISNEPVLFFLRHFFLNIQRLMSQTNPTKKNLMKLDLNAGQLVHLVKVWVGGCVL